MAKKPTTPPETTEPPVIPASLPAPLTPPGDRKLGEKARSNLNKFILSLPPTVKDSLEINWVYCHPRMIERSESTSNLKPLVVELKDVKTPVHGPAPSQRAIQLFRYWVQTPQKFFSEQLTAQAKRAHNETDEDDEREEMEYLDDLKEVDKMIRDATKTTRIPSEKSRATAKPTA